MEDNNGKVISTPIQKFYAGRSIFITGVSGFLGKALLEKLLRSCPDIHQVFVLIRSKRNLTAEERLKNITDLPLFHGLQPTAASFPSTVKVVPIDGDITKDGLGISTADQETLIRHVSMVFHSAATVRFDEGLRLAIDVNVKGTERVVTLCRKMKNLQALIHLSTAYVNCDMLNGQDERFHSLKFDPEFISRLVKDKTDLELEEMTPSIISDKPNTYTFTKAWGEHVLQNEAANLEFPVCIVRPSIVTATWKEPVPGWVDNLNGPTGLTAACGAGILRTLICHRDKIVDIVPLDMVANCVIAAGWSIGIGTNKHNPEVVIINCATSDSNPILWKQFQEHFYIHFSTTYPLSRTIWFPTTQFRKSILIDRVHGILVHFIPAIIIDSISVLSRNRPWMLGIHGKLRKSLGALRYFTTREWKFATDNLRRLCNQMDPKDKILFNINLKEIHWPEYIENYCKGIRVYVLKDDLSTLPAARKRMQRLYWIHNLTQFIILIVFGYFVTMWSSAITNWF